MDAQQAAKADFIVDDEDVDLLIIFRLSVSPCQFVCRKMLCSGNPRPAY
jgi:hypothetical protein